MSAEIHLGDVGTVFTATILDENGAAVDVSSASELTLVYNKPDGTAIERTAVLVNDGTDGMISYTTIALDIDQVGTWRVQGYVAIGTSEFYSDVHVFRVYPNLTRPPA